MSRWLKWFGSEQARMSRAQELAADGQWQRANSLLIGLQSPAALALSERICDAAVAGPQAGKRPSASDLADSSWWRRLEADLEA